MKINKNLRKGENVNDKYKNNIWRRRTGLLGVKK